MAYPLPCFRLAAPTVLLLLLLLSGSCSSVPDRGVFSDVDHEYQITEIGRLEELAA